MPNTILATKNPFSSHAIARVIMSSSMTLEEKFEALMKNCEHLQVQNEEMAYQNAYLRR